jgi:hypothetical protein
MCTRTHPAPAGIQRSCWRGGGSLPRHPTSCEAQARATQPLHGLARALTHAVFLVVFEKPNRISFTLTLTFTIFSQGHCAPPPLCSTHAIHSPCSVGCQLGRRATVQTLPHPRTKRASLIRVVSDQVGSHVYTLTKATPYSSWVRPCTRTQGGQPSGGITRRSHVPPLRAKPPPGPPARQPCGGPGPARTGAGHQERRCTGIE